MLYHCSSCYNPTSFTVTYIQFTGIYCLKHCFHAQIFLFNHTDIILIKCTIHLSIWKVDKNQPWTVTKKVTPIHMSTHLDVSQSRKHAPEVTHCDHLLNTIHSSLHPVISIIEQTCNCGPPLHDNKLASMP